LPAKQCVLSSIRVGYEFLLNKQLKINIIKEFSFSWKRFFDISKEINEFINKINVL